MEAALEVSSTSLAPAAVPPTSPGISVEFHGDAVKTRPRLGGNLSAPAVQTYQSPIRQHKRTPSQHREVKETLNARTEYTSDDQDGRSHHRINQYTILEEIGRGSYGSVHLATDQYGNEFAIKEFSKARLRKRAQSIILKGPRLGQFPSLFDNRPGGFRFMVGSRLNDHRSAEAKDALHLIREEIAIMKKLNHPNLVQLIEVLDDPEEDSLYMVMEMCKKGVIMKVGLDQVAEPHPEELCRHWFRDLILGIEYCTLAVHAQSIVHRDIKPDNLLLTQDDVLKIVDFGVSEMFEQAEEMRTAKSAGSPAFLPPELCVAKHGNVSGTAADIWSMGVSLYCLRYGRIPFDRPTPMEIYEAIKNELMSLPADEGADFVHLMNRILEKDPDMRIKMAELREHAWVTKRGSDPLLSADENCAKIVDPPNELEVNHAFTRRMSHLLCVMKAISKFKGLLHSRSMPGTPHKPLGGGRCPEQAGPLLPSAMHRLTSRNPEVRIDPEHDREEHLKSTTEQAAALVAERNEFLRLSGRTLTPTGRMRKGRSPSPSPAASGAVDRTTPEAPGLLFLGIGTGGRDDFATDEPPADVVSDSPIAADFNIYDRAYEAEIDRIQSSKRDEPQLTYLTRFVDEKKLFGKKEGPVEEEPQVAAPGPCSSRGSSAGQTVDSKLPQGGSSVGHKFADLVSRTMLDAKDKATRT